MRPQPWGRTRETPRPPDAEGARSTLAYLALSCFPSPRQCRAKNEKSWGANIETPTAEEKAPVPIASPIQIVPSIKKTVH